MTEIWTAIIGAAAIIAVAIIGWMQAVTLKRVTMAEQARRDGPNTDKALRSFQDRAKGMTEGVCDAAMRKLLGL